MTVNKLKLEKTFSLGGDLTIKRIGFGAMRITGPGIWGPPENEKEALRVLKRAIELGVNFIDTADSYGPNISEELIAKALYPYPKGLVIGTKGGLLRTGLNEWPIDASPKHLKEVLEGSRKRLKLDRIDLYQLHRIDPNVPVEKTFEFLQKAQHEGKIKHIGLSEVDVKDIKKAQQFFDVVSVENRYNISTRQWEDVLEYCNNNKIAFIPWFPLDAGRTDNLKALGKIAVRHNASMRQIALSWLYHHSNNILLIPGTASVEHLEENMKIASIQLTDSEMHELSKVADNK